MPNERLTLLYIGPVTLQHPSFVFLSTRTPLSSQNFDAKTTHGHQLAANATPINPADPGCMDIALTTLRLLARKPARAHPTAYSAPRQDGKIRGTSITTQQRRNSLS